MLNVHPHVPMDEDSQVLLAPHPFHVAKTRFECTEELDRCKQSDDKPIKSAGFAIPGPSSCMTLTEQYSCQDIHDFHNPS